jgi:hypothetical protein
VTYWDIVEYLDKALEQFKNDPADTDYQRGYEAALRELRRVIEAEADGNA